MTEKLHNSPGAADDQNRPAPASLEAAPALHPLNDPQEWLRSPMYDAPAEVDILRAQKDIDSIVGATRDNNSIIKVFWAGDRKFWLEYFMAWSALGQPVGNALKRPMVRYKVLREPLTRKFVRDVFPPRWLLAIRLEPEQYAATWKHESWFFAPEINAYKQIRPDDPPKEVWLWYATIARHNDYCCATAAQNKHICYGEYAPPAYYLPFLREQKRACENSGLSSNPFEQVDASMISEIEQENNGYIAELAQMKIDSEIFIDNPFALLGTIPASSGEMTAKKAEARVKEYFDKRIDETAKLVK